MATEKQILAAFKAYEACDGNDIVEFLRAVIDAAEAAAWSTDISAAPKDGTRVLWWVDFDDERRDPGLVVGHWCDASDGFVLKTGDDEWWHERGIRAWRPLPTPPVQP